MNSEQILLESSSEEEFFSAREELSNDSNSVLDQSEDDEMDEDFIIRRKKDGGTSGEKSGSIVPDEKSDDDSGESSKVNPNECDSTSRDKQKPDLSSPTSVNAGSHSVDSGFSGQDSTFDNSANKSKSNSSSNNVNVKKRKNDHLSSHDDASPALKKIQSENFAREYYSSPDLSRKSNSYTNISAYRKNADLHNYRIGRDLNVNDAPFLNVNDAPFLNVASPDSSTFSSWANQAFCSTPHDRSSWKDSSDAHARWRKLIQIGNENRGKWSKEYSEHKRRERRLKKYQKKSLWTPVFEMKKADVSSELRTPSPQKNKLRETLVRVIPKFIRDFF